MIPIGIVDSVEVLALELGCKVGSLPSSYLGLLGAQQMTTHLIYNFLTYHHLSSPYSAFISTLSSVSLSKTMHEFLSHLG